MPGETLSATPHVSDEAAQRRSVPAIAVNDRSYKWPVHPERFEGRPSRFPDCVRPQDERLIPQ